MQMKSDPKSSQEEQGPSSQSVVGRLLAQISHWLAGPSPEPVELPQASIGDAEGGKIRVIAFSAGGANDVFAFGTVHAFLVSDPPQKPHIVTGTSAGSVVAAMLADVLQAGEAEDPGPRRLAQVARFRSLLDRVQRFPEDFTEAALPDFTEVSARAGLEPLDLPTQQQDEKEDRKLTALARFGLTRLINGMFSTRTRIRELTRLIRLVLELQALDEWRWKRLRRFLPGKISAIIEIVPRFMVKLWIAMRIWRQSAVPVVRDAPILARCASAPWQEWVRERVADAPRTRKVLEKLGLQRSKLRKAKTILFEPLGARVGRYLVLILSYPMVFLVWLFAPPALICWWPINRMRLTGHV